MAHTAFSLEDNLVAYAGGSRASILAALPEAFDDIDVGCLLGLIAFDDAASVHADHWEIHPEGDEVLVVLDGRLRVVIDRDGVSETSELGTGEALIVPRACWHRLDVVIPGRMLFLTPGAGTALRPLDLA